MVIPIDDETRRFLEQPYLLKLATLNRDGSPQLTPLWFEYVDGEFVLTTAPDRLKVSNVRRDDRVAACIDSPPPAYRRVLIKGRARVTEEGVREWTRRIAARYVPPERLAERAARLLSAPRVLIWLTPERISRG